MGRRSRNLPMPDFSPGFLERFAEIEEIGAGGMARVFRARQRGINRAVAIKLIHPLAVRDTATMQRFLQEARITAKLQHPNIIKILDTGEEADLPYLVFEFIEGSTLEDRLRRDGALTLDAAVKISTDVCDALAYAHDRGIIHRDLKPENLLFTGEGTVKIADFGLAKLEDSSRRLTGIGFSVGTPGYMSPEQVLGYETDGRSDVFAAGVMFYEMLTGVLPYPSHNDMNVMLERLQRPHPKARTRREELPSYVDELLEVALAFEAKDRYQTALEMKEALESVLDPAKRKRKKRVTTRAQAIPAPVQAAPPSSRSLRRTALAAAAALGFVLLCAGAVVGYRALQRTLADDPGGHDAAGIEAVPGIAAARVTWKSSRPYLAAVRYWDSQEPESAARTVEEKAPTDRHSVEIAGVAPDATVHYRLVYPDGTQSLRYRFRLEGHSRLEVEPPLLEAKAGGAELSWKTNVPVLATVQVKRGTDVRSLTSSASPTREHRVLLGELDLLERAPSIELECVAPGASAKVVLPLISAREAARQLAEAASSLDLESVVQRFDSQVRAGGGTPDGLLPEPLVRAVAQFRPVASLWFSRVPLDEKLRLYHALAKLESIDALWAGAGRDLPVRASELYRAFVRTDFRVSADGLRPVAGDLLSGSLLRSTRTPAGLLPAAGDGLDPVESVEGTLTLDKRELDESDRVWIFVRSSGVTREEHLRVRVNAVLDLYFRPFDVASAGMTSGAGEVTQAPPPGEGSYPARSVPAELMRPGPNRLEITFDGVPGVAPMHFARLLSVHHALAHGP